MKNAFGTVIFLFFINIYSYSQLPLNNLIDYWSFSGNARDTIGGNNGIVNGATLTADRFGNPNSAYYFDGINDNISLLFQNDININTKSTIMLWFKANAVQQMYCKLLCVPFSLTTWNNPYHYLAFSGPAFSYANFDSPYGICETEPFTETVDTTWNLLSFTYDLGEIHVSINSEFKESIQCSSTLLPLNGTMSIGSRSTNSANDGEYFAGIIDDISIYNRVLTQAEITAYYNNFTCFESRSNKISTYYVSSSNFKGVDSRMYLDTTVTMITNKGCDSIISYYSKFVYNEKFVTDTVHIINTITVVDSKIIFDTVNLTNSITVIDSIAVTDTLIIKVLFTSFNQSENENIIKVYPNPTNDIIFINVGESYEQLSDYTIKIISETGSIIFERDITESIFDVNLSKFGKSGLYYIQIFDNTGKLIEVRKIVLI